MTIELPWQRGEYPGAKATAARVRRFARVTGLKPSRAYTRVFGELGLSTPAESDHTNVWRDGSRYIVTTEPYGRRGTLEEWCNAHGWGWRMVPGMGMWNPPHTILYMLSPPKNGGDLDRVLRRSRPPRDIVAEMERLGGFYHVPAGPYVVSVNDATTDPVEVDYFAADGPGAWTMKVPRRLWDRKSVLEYIAAWDRHALPGARVSCSRQVCHPDWRRQAR